MEHICYCNKLNSRQLQLLYAAAGDYWEVFDEVCKKFNVEKIWDLNDVDFGTAFEMVKDLARTAPAKYKDL